MNPSAETIKITLLDTAGGAVRMNELVALLIDSVAGGASIGFHHPLDPRAAAAFWQSMFADVDAERRSILIAEEKRRIVGVVMLVFPMFENGFNRADVQKLLVLQSHRRRGIARLLMAKLEALAREHGRGVLVLDSSTGTDGNHFYQQAGWQHVGDVPAYASMPDGRLHPTSIFYKLLEEEAR